MKHRSKDHIHWIEYGIFSEFPWLKHGSFYRYGGVSPPPFASLNFSVKVNDTVRNVEENIKRTSKALGIEKINFCEQVHGVEIYNLDEHSDDHPLPEADALITSRPNIALGVLHADCQATIFFDPIKKILCLAHAGWRGQAQAFYSRILKHFQVQYGSQTKDILVSIGPSLGPNHAKFDLSTDALSDLQKKHQLQATPYFNLWDAAREELECSGVPSEHIEIASVCSYDHSGCFSHRRNRENAGRNITIATMQLV